MGGQPPMGGASLPSNTQQPLDEPIAQQPMDMNVQNTMPIDTANEMPPQEEGSEIDGVFNQLSDTDKKAALSYAKSLLDRSEKEKKEEDASVDMPQAENAPVQPMQEYRKINGRLVRENLGIASQDKEEKKGVNKKSKANPNSPFSSPLK